MRVRLEKDSRGIFFYKKTGRILSGATKGIKEFLREKAEHCRVTEQSQIDFVQIR